MQDQVKGHSKKERYLKKHKVLHISFLLAAICFYFWLEKFKSLTHILF